MIMNKQRKAVFLDRDGVIVQEKPSIATLKDITIFPFAPLAIERLKRLDFLVIIISNQTVVSKGIISEDEMLSLNNFIFNEIEFTLMGAKIDDFFYCPHHPDAQIVRYRMNCECRKPKPGLILSAQQKYNIDLKNSFFIGDRISDVVAGNLAGCGTILVNTGEHNSPPIKTDLIYDNDHKKPLHQTENLLSAVKILEDTLE